MKIVKEFDKFTCTFEHNTKRKLLGIYLSKQGKKFFESCVPNINYKNFKYLAKTFSEMNARELVLNNMTYI